MKGWMNEIMLIVICLVIGAAVYGLVDWVVNTGIGTSLTDSIQNFFTDRVPASL